MNQREAFEAWKRRELKNMDLTDFPIEVVRDAWQAAIQHATEVAEECIEYEIGETGQAKAIVFAIKEALK